MNIKNYITLLLTLLFSVGSQLKADSVYILKSHPAKFRARGPLKSAQNELRKLEGKLDNLYKNERSTTPANMLKAIKQLELDRKKFQRDLRSEKLGADLGGFDENLKSLTQTAKRYLQPQPIRPPRPTPRQQQPIAEIPLLPEIGTTPQIPGPQLPEFNPAALFPKITPTPTAPPEQIDQPISLFPIGVGVAGTLGTAELARRNLQKQQPKKGPKPGSKGPQPKSEIPVQPIQGQFLPPADLPLSIKPLSPAQLASLKDKPQTKVPAKPQSALEIPESKPVPQIKTPAEPLKQISAGDQPAELEAKEDAEFDIEALMGFGHLPLSPAQQQLFQPPKGPLSLLGTAAALEGKSMGDLLSEASEWKELIADASPGEGKEIAEKGALDVMAEATSKLPDEWWKSPQTYQAGIGANLNKQFEQIDRQIKLAEQGAIDIGQPRHLDLLKARRGAIQQLRAKPTALPSLAQKGGKAFRTLLRRIPK